MAAKKETSKDRMAAAEQWVNDYQPNKFALGNFHKNLESGTALGYVAMGIDANLAAKHFKKKDLERPKIGPFPNKVRITAFINWCKSYGCDERDVFRTVYLSEPKDQKDLDHVVRTLENLSSLIESKGGKQSRLIGIAGRKKLAKSKDKNYKSAQTASYDTYGIVKHPNVAKSNWTAKQYEATHKSKANPTGKVDTSKWTKPAQKKEEPASPQKVNASKWNKPKPKQAATTKPKPQPQTETKAAKPKPPPPPTNKSNDDDYKKQSSATKPAAVYSGNDNPNKNKSYGFSAESQAKQASKYNLGMEKQVVGWINKCVGGVQGGGAANLQKSLKNGVILCKLANTIKPNSIKGKICVAGVGKKGAMANFADKQRINEFSRVAKLVGLQPASTFEADDLWEAKNMTAVLIGLYGLGVVCHQKKIAGAQGGIVGKGKTLNRGGSLYQDMESLE